MAPIERALAWMVRAAAFLVLPLSLLLFLQWPLREVVHAYSREANDTAQILFAVYVAVAVTAATRAKAHLAVDLFTRRYPVRWRLRLDRAASLLISIPASLFVLVAGARPTWTSVLQLERFPETLNAGYFLLRIAVMALAALVLAQGVIDLAAPRRDAT